METQLINIEIAPDFEFLSAQTNADFVSLNAEKLMSCDVWSTKIFPSFSKEEENDYPGKDFDFSRIHSPVMKEEAKKYVMSRLESGLLLKTLTKNMKYLNTVIEYLENDCPYVDVDKLPELSILDVPTYTEELINEETPFFESHKSLGRIRQIFMAFRKFISDLEFPEPEGTPEEEMQRDRIRLDKLGFDVAQSPSCRRDSLTLSEIRLPWLKKLCEHYILNRLKYMSVSTVSIEIRNAQALSEALISSGSEITCIDDLTEQDAMNIIAYCGSFGYSPSTYNGYITGIKNMVRGFYDLGLCETDVSTKFSKYRPARRIKKEPEVFSEREMELIYEVIPDMPAQVSRVILILITSGWRIGDVLNLRTESPLIEINGTWHIQTVQQKTKDLVTMPCLDETVPEILKMAIADSEKKFGKCDFVFAKSADRPITTNYVRDHLYKALSAIDARDDKGNLFKPKLHSFRRTRISDLVVNCKIEPEIAAAIIGHKGIRSLAPYARISDEEFVEAINPLHEELDSMIKNKGYAKENEDESEILLPLLDGACARPIEYGKCEKLGNECFMCRMFHAQKVFLPYYKKMYSGYLHTYQYAMKTGCTLLAEKAQEMMTALEKIIKKLDN